MQDSAILAGHRDSRSRTRAEHSGKVSRIRLLLACLASLFLLWLTTVAVRNFFAMRAMHAALRTRRSARSVQLLRRARRLRPDLSRLWRLSSEYAAFTHPSRGVFLIRRAIALNRHNWKNWANYGLLEYQDGHAAAALHALHQASHLDSGFSSHFQLAQLAWVLGKPHEFWQQMRKALAIAPPSDIEPALFQIDHLAGDHPHRLLSVMPPHRTLAGVQVMHYLILHHHLHMALRLWRQLPCPVYRQSPCQNASLELLHAWAQRLLPARAANATVGITHTTPPRAETRAAAAASSVDKTGQIIKIWNHAVRHGWLEAAPAAWGKISDGHFHDPWLGGFSWNGNLNAVNVLTVGAPISGNCLQSHLNGTEPSSIVFASAWLPVRSGQRYRIGFYARGIALHHAAGIGIALRPYDGSQFWALMAHLSAQWKYFHHSFTAPAGQSLLRLSLVYQRPYGHDLMRGQVELASVSVAPLPSGPAKPAPPTGGGGHGRH